MAHRVGLPLRTDLVAMEVKRTWIVPPLAVLQPFILRIEGADNLTRGGNAAE